MPVPSTLGGERLPGAFDIGCLEALDQVLGRTHMAVAEVGGVAHVHERQLAPVERRLDLLPEPLVSKRDALAGDEMLARMCAPSRPRS